VVRATPSVQFRFVSVLGDRLALGRADKGWSQKRTAAEIGIPESTWSDWERGKVRPRPEKLRKIAETLDISHEELSELLVLAAEEPAALEPRLEERVETLQKEVKQLKREVKELKREIEQAMGLLQDVTKLRNALLHAPSQAPAATGR
jgi:transcriptional regulator with XRE-family HTH domain